MNEYNNLLHIHLHTYIYGVNKERRRKKRERKTTIINIRKIDITASRV
jgi:hypothetical protein